MTEELIIDGQKVDLGSDNIVTLNYKSNLLGDISDIETSYSQTIKLPKTVHNMEVLDSPTAPAYNSAFRGVYHTAQYRRNGVQIIGDGRAVLLDCDEDYEIALYWGLKAKLESWTDENADLSALGWKPTTGTLTWETDTVSDSINENALVWALYNAGINPKWFERLQIGRHPFVCTWTLFNLICSNLGIAWNAGDEIQDAIKGTGIFLPTHKSDTAVTYAAEITQRSTSFVVSFEENDLFSVETDTVSYNRGSYIYVVKITVNNDGTVWFNYNLKFTGQSGYVYLQIMQNGDTIVSKSVALSSSGTFYYIAGGLFVAAYSGDVFDIRCYYAGQSSAALYSGSYFNFTPPSTDIDIEIGDTFPVSYNMPDLSQVDFFKGICNMFGLFVMPDGDGLQLVTLDRLYENKANAVDWSDRLVWSGVPCEPQKVKFALGDYAQNNNFKYKEDDDVRTSADGVIYLNDQTLDKSKDAVELPFSPSDQSYYYADSGRTRVTVCDLHHYSWSGDEPEDTVSDDDMPDWNTEDVNPRIVELVVNSGVVLAQFSSAMYFKTLLSTYYGTLKSMLNDAVVITENFRLDEFDLLELDFLKPVYLRQYGRYYGIVSIQTKDDATCDVELAQLPILTE